MIPLKLTAGSRKTIAIRVDLKPRHRGSDTAHMRRTARCPSRQLRRTAEMAGVLSFAGARANGEVAPQNEPARAGGEHLSWSVRHRRGDCAVGRDSRSIRSRASKVQQPSARE